MRIRKRIKRWLCGPPRIFSTQYRVMGDGTGFSYEKEKQYQKTRALKRLLIDLERHGVLEHREIEQEEPDERDYTGMWVLRA